MMTEHVTKEDLVFALETHREMHKKDMDLIFQGQAAQVSLIQGIKGDLNNITTCLNGNGKDGMKVKIDRCELHRIRVENIIDKLTVKIILLLLTLIGIAGATAYTIAKIGG